MATHFECDDDNVIRIFGDLDEFYPYEDLFKLIKPDRSYLIDLGKVGRMNSCGVREWVRALMAVRSELTYCNCPGFFIDQISLIPQLMPANVTVGSFQAVFSCVACDEEQVTSYNIGDEYKAGDEEVEPPPDQNCKSCGGVAEFSHNPDTFFSFLASLKPAG